MFSFQNVLVALAMAQDDDRKVPPRTPPQRLNTLHRFANEWVNIEIGETINRPSRAANMIAKGIARLEEKMTAAYAKDCHFFDPTVAHGGPRPARKYYLFFKTLELGPRTNQITGILKENDEEPTGSNVNSQEFKEKSMPMTIWTFSINTKKI